VWRVVSIRLPERSCKWFLLMAALDSNSDRAVGGDDIVDLMLIHVHIFVYTVLVSIKKVWSTRDLLEHIIPMSSRPNVNPHLTQRPSTFLGSVSRV
jgi:hypothetical protein